MTDKFVLHLQNIASTDEVTDAPDETTLGLTMSSANNLVYAVDLAVGVTGVGIQEWYRFQTSDGKKWFAGTATNLTKSTCLNALEVNCIGFYPQITSIDGTGDVNIYAAADLIK